MSCCGCASRVLKLQSEMRSWKTKLGDEKREKKMILKWIQTVFGYDVKVDVERSTRGIRLEANENKEAKDKALLKLQGIGGNEGDFGVMVMEVKLEDNEFFEPFEEPHDIPEFPILEINSMPTSSQTAPIVNTGITPSFAGQLSQSLNPVPSLGLTTPMEVAAPVPVVPNNSVGVVGDQEVLYLAGDFESGATLEGPNGQSFIIVRTNEGEDISSTIPMQMDYTTNIVNVNDNVITDDGSGNLVLNTGVPIPPEVPVTFLPNLSGKPISIANTIQIPPQAVAGAVPMQISFAEPVIPPPPPPIVVDNVQFSQIPQTTQTTTVKSQTKKKNKSQSLSAVSSATFPSSFLAPTSTSSSKGCTPRKKKQASSSASSSSMNGNETDIKIKSVTGAATKQPSTSSGKSKSKGNKKHCEDLNGSSSKKLPSPSSSYDFNLTLREPGDMFVMQKAKEAVGQQS